MSLQELFLAHVYGRPFATVITMRESGQGLNGPPRGPEQDRLRLLGQLQGVELLLETFRVQLMDCLPDTEVEPVGRCGIGPLQGHHLGYMIALVMQMLDRLRLEINSVIDEDGHKS